jgi:hypothetical protein
MKDRRIDFVRGALTELLDSLDATVRIARWDDAETVPPPLRASADLLGERLSRANRLAADRFVGPPTSVRAIADLSQAIVSLDRAFVAYCDRPDHEESVLALDAEIARVRADDSLALS